MTDEAAKLQLLLDNLQSDDPAQRRSAALQLGMMRNPVVLPDLIRAAGDEDNGVRSFIASSLAAMGEPALARIRGALTDDNANVRLTMISALRHMKNVSVVDDLAVLLDDDNRMVQNAAADALRAINTPEAHEALAGWDE